MESGGFKVEVSSPRGSFFVTQSASIAFLEILKMYLHNTQAMFECNSLLRLVFDAKYEFLIKETVPFIKKKLLYKYTHALWILF